ncbi:hypothetical protein GCM10023162_21350 [Klenkia terrae]
MRAVVRLVVAGTIASVVITHLAYLALGLTFDALPVKLVAHGLPFLMPLVIAPITAIPWVRLQNRLAAANARLAQEVDRRTALQDELEHQARTDPLTAIANRRGFFEAAEAIAVEGAVVVLLDLDDFKSVNDTLGHAAGDVVLQAVVRVVEGVCRPPGGVVCRLGGDEFVALLPPGCGPVAARLRQRLARLEVPVPGRGTAITSASVGVVVMAAGQSVDEALAVVDTGMYERKRAVRGLA